MKNNIFSFKKTGIKELDALIDALVYADEEHPVSSGWFTSNEKSGPTHIELIENAIENLKRRIETPSVNEKKPEKEQLLTAIVVLSKFLTSVIRLPSVQALMIKGTEIEKTTILASIVLLLNNKPGMSVEEFAYEIWMRYPQNEL